MNGRLTDRVTLGPWRRRRRMMRALRELDRLDRLDRAAFGARSAGGRRTRAPGRGAANRLGSVAGSTLLVGAGVWVFSVTQLGVSPLQWWAGQDRLLSTPEVELGVGTYRYLQTVSGTGDPVAYDPCRPIRWVLNPKGAPAGADTLVGQAIAEVSAATGLAFEYAGTTDERPSPRRPLSDPARYGRGHSPVLISWSDPARPPGCRATWSGSAAAPHSRRTSAGPATSPEASPSTHPRSP